MKNKIRDYVLVASLLPAGLIFGFAMGAALAFIELRNVRLKEAGRG